VDFLEGIAFLIQKGRPDRRLEAPPSVPDDRDRILTEKNIEERYCVEALLSGRNLNLGEVRDLAGALGSSAIVAGGEERARVHLHTDDPERFFSSLMNMGDILQVKADDMLRQHQAVRDRISDIALVTDSACDLPGEILDRCQIHVIPFSILFGRSHFLDKLTLSPAAFYDMLESRADLPSSSQPGLKMVRDVYAFLSRHYRHVIGIHISGELSGMVGLAAQAADELGADNIRVFDSRQLTSAQGLIVLRIADALRRGLPFPELAGKIEDWIASARILVDVQTLKYMVRGGRVSALKGALAGALNLKPIISLDDKGKAVGYGRSFSRAGNMKKILRMVERAAREHGVWRYAVVHARNPARAERYAENLTGLLGMEPAFIMPLSPVVGVHNGIGAVGITLLLDKPGS
jgi:DegV family protein with EDD domain